MAEKKSHDVYALTYWCSAGTYQSLADELQKRIPPVDECPPGTPKLERLRKSVNAYYDLYNNGGCNRAREINAFLKIRVRDFNSTDMDTFQEAVDKAEMMMDLYVLEAALEAGMTVCRYRESE